MTTHNFGITYDGSGTGYIVFDLEDPHAMPLFKSESKSECIAEAERLNDWPITGDEQAYAKQRLKARGF